MIIISQGKAAESSDIIVNELLICASGILELLSNFQESYLTKASWPGLWYVTHNDSSSMNLEGMNQTRRYHQARRSICSLKESICYHWATDWTLQLNAWTQLIPLTCFLLWVINVNRSIPGVIAKSGIGAWYLNSKENVPCFPLNTLLYFKQSH